MSTENSVLEHQVVLSLNALWQPIGWTSIRKAVTAMTGGNVSTRPALALDITMDASGRLISANPMVWDEWIKLPIRGGDISLGTKSGAIRAPVALVSPDFGEMPLKTARLSPNAIWDRDGGTCQYSGKKLTKKQGNLDHVLAKSRGGKDSWENVVLCDRKINSAKGNRLNSEMGLKLLRKPKAPTAIPASFSVREPRHPAHAPFIHQ
jgi:hypothetical protein